MGMGRRKHRQDTLWGCDRGVAANSGPRILRTGKPNPERDGVRPVRRGCVREVLRRSDGSAEPGTGQVFSDAAGGLL